MESRDILILFFILKKSQPLFLCLFQPCFFVTFCCTRGQECIVSLIGAKPIAFFLYSSLIDLPKVLKQLKQLKRITLITDSFRFVLLVGPYFADFILIRGFLD